MKTLVARKLQRGYTYGLYMMGTYCQAQNHQKAVNYFWQIWAQNQSELIMLYQQSKGFSCGYTDRYKRPCTNKCTVAAIDRVHTE